MGRFYDLGRIGFWVVNNKIDWGFDDSKVKPDSQLILLGEVDVQRRKRWTVTPRAPHPPWPAAARKTNSTAQIIRQHPALFTVAMGMGAASWLVGNMLWLAGLPIAQVVLWWAAFLVLTIAGERLELGRLRALPRRATLGFGILVAGMLLATTVASLSFGPGARLSGACYLALALWLGRYDIARRTIRKAGLTRYIAACLLSSFVWLGVAGLVGLVYGGIPARPIYDAMLHALFVGFVFAMIFGHAPIILPAVLGIPVPFHTRLYLPLVLLHASLVLRVAGDLLGLMVLRQWGGLLNGLTILLFFVLLATARLLAERRPACGRGDGDDLPLGRGGGGSANGGGLSADQRRHGGSARPPHGRGWSCRSHLARRSAPRPSAAGGRR